VATPSFAQILHYEYQIRKEQAKLNTKGHSFKDALEAACKDYSIRERHFVTPMAVSAISARPPADPPRRPRSRSPRRGNRGSGSSGGRSGGYDGGRNGGKGSNKGVGKGSGKGCSKGKGKRGTKGGGAIRTPDGKQICFAYNNAEEKCPGNCDRAHVCRKCLGSRPSYMCTKNANR
jgi:hypothetical protein